LIRPTAVAVCRLALFFHVGENAAFGNSKLPPEQTVYATLAIGEIRENAKT